MNHQFPKLHNAVWPGVVGKVPNTDQPPIDLDTMLELTASAEVNGIRFDGVDLFLYEPHVSIDITQNELRSLVDRIASQGLVVGSVVAPVWEPTEGGSAMGTEHERTQFLIQVEKACRIAQALTELGIRPYGIVRIDSAVSPTAWCDDPEANQTLIADTFREASHIAAGYEQRLAAEGEICWGGMHSWKWMVDLLERVNQPDLLGFQADMAHTLLYTLGYNAEEHRILSADFDWNDREALDSALGVVADALRSWTIDFHVAQNDGTVHGSGSHDRTGRHCLPNDPHGRLEIPRHAGLWMRDSQGELTKAFQHICWDGCMFSNDVLMQPQTWNDILAAMIEVRSAHGWS